MTASLPGDAQTAAASADLSGAARVAGVIGWPVAHSLSPRLHGYWLRRYGIDGAYVPMPVRPDHLGDGLAALATLGFVGANVTIPHKERACILVDARSDVAARTGAVNTVIVEASGRLYGTNTDVFGFLANLEEGAPAWRADQGPAVVLGAGGAARAVVLALLDAGVPELRLVNRDEARARRLAEALGGAAIRVRPWSARDAALAGARLVVNATSLEMGGHSELELDLGRLPDTAVVNDIVYVPLRTRLLEQAAARGFVTVDGLGMLLHQARPAFHAWYGVDPEVTPALRRDLERALASF